MARIRTIKPGFFRSRAVRRLSMPAKLVWIGLWPIADDEGRLIDEPSLIVGDLWSLGLTDEQVDDALYELAEAGRIIRYKVDGEGFLQVTNWSDHQKISKPYPSEIPPPPVAEDSGNVPGTLPVGREGKGIGREGNARALTPFCSAHPTGTDKPCRACGNARRAFDAALAAEKSKPTPGPYDCKKSGHRPHPHDPAHCVACGEPVEVAS